MDKNTAIRVLKEERRLRKIRIQDAAKSLGVHRNTLGRIESGETEIVSYDLIESYANLLDMELRFLIK